MFKKYEKIYSLLDNEWNFREESDWILNWFCYVQEKIDWANLSIWQDNWQIRIWSRNQDVTEWSFRWAVDYIKSHDWINKLFNEIENIRLYWEWLVPHTITSYSKENYNNFYIFDIEIDWIKQSIDFVYDIANKYNIKTPILFYKWKIESINDILKYVWKSNIWPVWEWIVIKNLNFINKFWNLTYAKIVWDNFKEENAIVFWNHQKWDIEMKLCNKYCTLWRVKKIINKIEQTYNANITKQDINKIIWMLQYDIISEEAWNIAKEWVVNFKTLKGLITKRCARMSIDIIEWNEESIVYNN